MKRLYFEIIIDASAEKVSRMMLEKDSYQQWTYEFNPGSFYEGSWDQGAKIAFVGISKEGKKEGMSGHIKTHVPNKEIVIEYDGVIEDGKERTEGADIEGWIGAIETYRFETEGNATHVYVTTDTPEEYEDYFQKTWPKALDKLKQICEI